jgi:uncharacterized protein involved in exopolysaccharide biosynthesis
VIDESKESGEIYGPLDLAEIWSVVRLKKWWISGICLLVVSVVLGYVFTTDNWYKAQVLLRLADSRPTQGLSSQLSGLGGLASLAGLNVSSGSNAEPLAVLTSREFTSSFITELDLLPVLFPKKWDASNKRWKSDNLSQQPDVRDGVRYFGKTIRSVEEDRKTGLITLSIAWKDPRVAANWANLLVDRVNEHMRFRALSEAESNVSYLKQELSSSSVVTLQESIGRVLESELQKLMLAKANREFAFRIIDHAEVPKWRYWPQRALLILLAFVLGIVGPTTFFVWRRFLARRNNEQSVV